MFEINLIPDAKAKMVGAQKVRNLVLFICIIVSAAALGIIAILFSIKGGQDIAMSQQDDRLNLITAKLGEYSNLDEILTIQNQLGSISSISEQKLAASRLFSLLEVMRYQGQDSITFSSLNLDLRNATLTIEGQANAMTEPNIDYRVLESFKKSSALIHFDYGRYVDKNNEEIPIACLDETDADGYALRDDSGYYVNWHKGRVGCDPSAEDTDSDEEADETTDETTDEETQTDQNTTEAKVDDTGEIEKIYRTPKFSEWYKAQHLTEDGEISGVAHFASQCTTYTGTKEKGKMVWTPEYSDDCLVSENELTITESSNGRDENDDLVLRFTADWEFNPDIFLYNHFFMEFIGPSGKNVTDSYIQIEGMFSQKALDCEDDDSSCLNNTTNSGGDE